MATILWTRYSLITSTSSCFVFAGEKTYQNLVKQSSLDDSFEASLSRDEDDDMMDGLKSNSDDDSAPTPPRPATPTVPQRTLPWKPKVR